MTETAAPARHTPGPWRYEAATKTIRAVPANYWLATMDSWDGAVNNEANARLMASAPELLEALRSLLPLAIHTSPEDVAVHAARAVIAKAKGCA